MKFDQIFKRFVEHGAKLKTISVASCDLEGVPNSASKMLIAIEPPNAVYFLDYKSTRTYSNSVANPRLSVSFMDDMHFLGYRLTGKGVVLESGEDYKKARQKWEKRLIRYEADRILQRVRGEYSARDAENVLPKDFVIIKLAAEEAAMIRPDRVFRAQ